MVGVRPHARFKETPPMGGSNAAPAREGPAEMGSVVIAEHGCNVADRSFGLT